MVEKEAIKHIPLSVGFYSQVFLAQKSSGAWRPNVDLLTLNHCIPKTSPSAGGVSVVLSSTASLWSRHLGILSSLTQIILGEMEEDKVSATCIQLLLGLLGRISLGSMGRFLPVS